MKNKKRWIAIGLICLVVTIGYSQTQWVWRVLPSYELGRSYSRTNALVPNNGWAIAKAYDASGWIHIVFTSDQYHPLAKPRVFWCYSTNGGRSFSSRFCLSGDELRTNGSQDSAWDASIAALGDTIAVAFYDKWQNGGDEYPPRQIVFTYRTDTNGTWDRLKPLTHTPLHSIFSKHPTVTVQRRDDNDPWRVAAHVLYTQTQIPTDSTDHTWIDAPMHNRVKIFPEFDVSAEERLGGEHDSSDFLSVTFNRSPNDIERKFFYFALQKLTPEGRWQIWFGRTQHSAGIYWKCLTTGDTYPEWGERPSIQCVSNDSTFAVAYQGPQGGYTRVYVAVVKWTGSAHILRNAPAFAINVLSGDLLFPNLWSRGDTVYMVFVRKWMYGGLELRQAYFSYSTNQGQNWQTPIPFSGLWFENSTLTAEWHHAYTVYSHGPLDTTSTNLQSIYFREIRAVASPVAWPPVKVDGISPNTARVLQQMQVPGSYLVRAYPVEDFVAVDRSTDNGLTWEDMFSPGWGRNPSIATDRDSVVVAFFVEDSLLYCAWSYPEVRDWTEPQVVFAGVSGLRPLNPSVALYPGKVGGMKVAGVVFAVYDTVEGKSRVMFAKVDTGTVILDTIEARNDLSDSFPCINIVNTDSVYVTYQRGSEVVSSALYNYSPGSTERPPDWIALGSITGDGFHPMSGLEGGILHCVWAQRIQPENASDTFLICHSTLDVTGFSQFAGWQEAPELSCRTTAEKDNPVYAGVGIVVWQEKLNGRWAIRAKVRGDTLTLIAGEHHCRYPQAVAESSAVSPSIDQVRVKLLWTEELAEDSAVLGFKVESLNVSRANANATRYNNGQKLVQKTGSDSLLAVYTDLDGAVMFARSATGDSWKRQVLAQDCEYPAIAYDGTGRLWAVMSYNGSAHTRAIEARYLNANGTWSNAQTVYSFSAQGSAGPVSIAPASDAGNPCCYAAFTYDNGAGNRFLIVAKFNGDSIRTDTITDGSNLGDPAIAVEPDAQGDYLHLVGSEGGEVKYTMTESRIQANNWNPGFPSAWRSAVNLSNSQAPSLHPVIEANENRVVVSWAEGVIPEILVRRRSTSDEYNNWLGAVNLSNTQDYSSDYPTIGLGDTCLISWQEERQNGDYDIMVSIEFGDPLNIADNPTTSTYPQVLFEKKASGDTTIPYLHCIWSEAAGENYYEVRYQRLNLNQAGGGGQQGGEFTYLEPRLYQSVPNPFSTRTQIRYQIGQEGNVLLKVYDTQGRLVRSLVSGRQRPGSYTVVWDGRDEQGRIMANGIYFYRLDVPHFSATKKAVLLR